MRIYPLMQLESPCSGVALKRLIVAFLLFGYSGNDFKTLISLALNQWSATHQVPRYLSQQWEKASDTGEVGKISLTK